MGKLSYFGILLKKQDPIYFPGELLIGTLKVKVIEKIKINSLSINIKGYAKVNWTEQKNYGKYTVNKAYKSNEKYIDLKIVLIGKKLIDNYIDVGEHSFPFEVILPTSLPTSYENKIGCIRYEIIGRMDIPWSFDKNTKRIFSVLSPYDLNKSSHLRKPYGISGEKTVCCLCCKSEPIVGTFSIKKAGFVPGDHILFSVNLHNKSRRKVKEMSVCLIQKSKFNAVNKSKTEELLVAHQIYNRSIDERSIEIWDSSILIPSVISTSNGKCKIIEIEYAVVFNFIPSGPSTSLNLEIPIVIGTIPFREECPPTPRPFSFEPSILECESTIFDDDIQETDLYETDDLTFRPVYLYFGEPNLPNTAEI